MGVSEHVAAHDLEAEIGVKRFPPQEVAVTLLVDPARQSKGDTIRFRIHKREKAGKCLSLDQHSLSLAD